MSGEDEKETAEDEDEGEKADAERKKLEDTDKDDREAKKDDKKETAMDAAMVELKIQQAVKEAVKRTDALHEAREMVKPIVGVVAMDSAEAVFKHALDKSGVDTKGVHSSAYKSMVGLVIKQKAQPQVKTAMDAASYEDDPLTSRFK